MTQRASHLKLGQWADLPVICFIEFSADEIGIDAGLRDLAGSPFNLAVYLNSGVKGKAAKLICPKEKHKPKVLYL